MGARKNVLLVANYEPQVGYAWWLMENFWLQVARTVASRGGRCVLIYPRTGAVPKNIAESSIEVVVHHFGNRSLGNLARLRRIIRANDIGSVYLTDLRYFDGLYAILRLWGVQRIVLHDHVPGEPPRPPVLRLLGKRFIHRLGVFSCDLYIGVSKFVARRMVETGGVPERRVTYVHNGVPASDTAPDESIRDLVGVGPEGILVVNVGRAHRYKGIDFFVDVAAELKRHGYHNVGFLHVGDGPDLAELKERAQARGLGDRFHFAGRREDVRSILVAADIALHTSLGEAFSLAILEYMSAGLAVLVPAHCGNGEAVDNGVDGVLYEAGNLEEATSKLIKLVDRPEWRRKLGAAARSRTDRQFRLDVCNREFRRVIRPLLLESQARRSSGR